MPRLATELSQAGPMTQDNPRRPGKPGALPGVGPGDPVAQSKVHHSKLAHLTLSENAVTSGLVTALRM